MSSVLKDYINIIIVILFASAISLFGSHKSEFYNEYPVLFLCMCASFVVHWIAFIPSYLAKTEKFYDITGTVAYIILLFIASKLTSATFDDNLHIRSNIAIGLVLVWALRLGIFLFIRVIKVGEDRRFREAKKSFSKYLLWWSMSALWVFLTTANALTLIINNTNIFNDVFFYFGITIWCTGFSFEVVADEQKRRFRANEQNKDRFISTGLWSISRHPNYFGEILIWVGMAVIAFPTLQGWQYVTLISPIFIYFLLTRISGVNLLEDRAEKKWGGNGDYEKYKKEVPVLFPYSNS